MENTKIGTIEIHRPKGTEIWNIESGRFSIDQPIEQYRLNIWVQSDIAYIKKLEDTGCNPISFELTIPLKVVPNFDDLWVYTFPDYQTVGKEDDGFFQLFYYYEHSFLKDIKLQIEKKEDDLYLIQINGTRHDPIDYRYGDAQYIISAYLNRKSTFNGKWDE